MSLFTKIFKVTAKNADDLFTSKTVKKTATKAAKTVASSFNNKGTLKTTAAIAGQGVSSATAGGRKVIAKVASETAKGAGTTAKVAGKVFAGTAIAAVPSLTGIGIYNNYKNSTALTDEDRRVSYLIDQQERVSALNQTSVTDKALENDPTMYGNTGGVGNLPNVRSFDGNGTFNPFQEVYGEEAQSEQGSGFGFLGLIAGIGAVGAGGYYLYKKSKKSKKGKK